MSSACWYCERAAAAALQCDADILLAGEVRKHRGNLERADEAEARDGRGLHRRDVAAIIGDPPAGGSEELGQQIEAGRLAGAIGAYQSVDAAAAHRQVHAVDSDKALELLGQA
jgi:hypothetical protein